MSSSANNRYKQLVKAIMRHVNIVSSGLNEPMDLSKDIVVTAQEWLVVEEVVEQRDAYNSMVELSRQIGIPQSSFSRMINHLQKVGLVEKYRVKGNKKNIVLRPTELAMQIYEEQTTGLGEAIWSEFYKELDTLTDENIITITNAISHLNERLPSARFSQELELVKID